MKHLDELINCISDGYEACAVFVVQMSDVQYFTPNRRMHPAFGEALDNAKDAGVVMEAFDCDVTPSSLAISRSVEVRL